MLSNWLKLNFFDVTLNTDGDSLRSALQCDPSAPTLAADTASSLSTIVSSASITCVTAYLGTANKNESANTRDVHGACILAGDSQGRLHILAPPAAGAVVCGKSHRQHHKSQPPQLMCVGSCRLFDRAISHMLVAPTTSVLIATGEDELGVVAIKLFSLHVTTGDNHDAVVVDNAASLLRQIRLPAPPPVLPPGGVSINCMCMHDKRDFLAVGFNDGRLILWRGDVTRERNVKHQLLQKSGCSPVSGLGFRSEPGKTTTTSSSAATAHSHYLFVASVESVCCYNITNRGKEVQSQLDSVGCRAGCAVMSTVCQSGGDRSEPCFVVGHTDVVYCYSISERGACYALDGIKQLMCWHNSYLLTVTDTDTDVEASVCTVSVYDVNNHYVAAQTTRVGHVRHVCALGRHVFVVTTDHCVHALTEHDLSQQLQLLFNKNLYDLGIRLARRHNERSDSLVAIYRAYGDHLYDKGKTSEAVEQYVKTIGSLAPSYVIRKYLDSQRVRELAVYLRAVHAAALASADHTTLLLNCYAKLRDTQRLDQFLKCDDVQYDVTTVVRVCRDCGYHRQAAAVAARHQRHLLSVAVLLDELQDATAAIDYIQQLPQAQREETILTHGVRLLQLEPAQTVTLLKHMCCENDVSGSLDNFVDLLISQPMWQMNFLHHIFEARVDLLSEELLLTLLELYLTASSDRVGSHCAGDDEISSSDHRQAALVLLNSGRLRGPMALHLCQIHAFSAGVETLYRAAGQFAKILQLQLDSGEYDAALNTCLQQSQRHQDAGQAHQPPDADDERADLWLHALKTMCAQAQPPHNAIQTMLRHIGESGIVALNDVIDILIGGGCGGVCVGTVRQFVCDAVSDQLRQIDQHSATARRLAADVDDTRRQITHDQTHTVIFQRSTCSACGQPLQLPVVHFLCAHSYHAHCVRAHSDSLDQCPVCQPHNQQLLAEITAQTEEIDTEVALLRRLRRTDDVLDVVADCVGRGLLPGPAIPQQTRTSAPTSAPNKVNVFESDLSLVTEARLRLEDSKSRGPIDIVSESRVRSGEVRSSVLSSVSESRLRSQQSSKVIDPVSESRLRSQQPDISAVSSSLSPSSGSPQWRTRSTVSGQVASPSQTSAYSNLSGANRPTSAVAKKRQNSTSVSGNPFETDESPSGSAGNPFELDDSKADESNPFLTNSPDYDEALNPFSEGDS